MNIRGNNMKYYRYKISRCKFGDSCCGTFELYHLIKFTKDEFKNLYELSKDEKPEDPEDYMVDRYGFLKAIQTVEDIEFCMDEHYM